MSTQGGPRCVVCGARGVELDDEGVCAACYLDRMMRRMTEQMDDEREQVKQN